MNALPADHDCYDAECGSHRACPDERHSCDYCKGLVGDDCIMRICEDAQRSTSAKPDP